MPPRGLKSSDNGSRPKESDPESHNFVEQPRGECYLVGETKPSRTTGNACV